MRRLVENKAFALFEKLPEEVQFILAGLILLATGNYKKAEENYVKHERELYQKSRQKELENRALTEADEKKYREVILTLIEELRTNEREKYIRPEIPTYLLPYTSAFLEKFQEKVESALREGNFPRAFDIIEAEKIVKHDYKSGFDVWASVLHVESNLCSTLARLSASPSTKSYWYFEAISKLAELYRHHDTTLEVFETSPLVAVELLKEMGEPELAKKLHQAYLENKDIRSQENSGEN